jgi:hypothetical protein
VWGSGFQVRGGAGAYRPEKIGGAYIRTSNLRCSLRQFRARAFFDFFREQFHIIDHKTL